jgi:hypothetical protein
LAKIGRLGTGYSMKAGDTLAPHDCVQGTQWLIVTATESPPRSRTDTDHPWIHPKEEMDIGEQDECPSVIWLKKS